MNELKPLCLKSQSKWANWHDTPVRKCSPGQLQVYFNLYIFTYGYLQGDVFRHYQLDQLRELRLDGNDLFSLPNDLLCPFPQLEQLSLQQNKLITFEPRLDCVVPLQELYLDHNIFTDLSENFRKFIDGAVHLRYEWWSPTLNKYRWKFCWSNFGPL